jgi:CheY-like chemotaxis protein
MSVHSHHSSSPSSHPLVPPRILIAEDDELQGAVLRETLISRGYHADIVGNGMEAVRSLCQGGYDLALIDFHLPDVDGLAAARLTQHLLCAESRPRMIAVTASESGLRDRQLGFGMTPFDCVVSKQNGLPALLTTVDASLSDRAMLQLAAQARHASHMRRRRRNTILAALPALTMVTLFVTAIGWTQSAMQGVDAAAHRAAAPVVIVLGLGVLYGLVSAALVAWRHWRRHCAMMPAVVPQPGVHLPRKVPVSPGTRARALSLLRRPAALSFARAGSRPLRAK